MSKRIMRHMAVWACVLLLLAAALPALAESVSAQAPVILLNGQPVEEAVLDLLQGKTLQFSASEPVSWKSSKTYRGTIDQNGLFTSVTSGTLNVTATTPDGRSAVCVVYMDRLVSSITISGDTEMTSGGRVTLKASVLPSKASDRDVKWSSSDPSVATVNSDGRVTAKTVDGVRTVVITAKAADRSGVSAQHTITVRPRVQSVSILNEGSAVQEIYLDLGSNPTAQLSAFVLPADALQNVKWSSNSSRVKVDQTGYITGVKTGSATITAAAQDGSGRKAAVKVNVVRMVTDIELTGTTGLLPGKSAVIKASVLPAGATQKKLEWSSSNPEIISVNKEGRITAKSVGAGSSAVITARATDGSGVYAQYTVKVLRPIEHMAIAQNGAEVTSLVLDMANPTIDLDAVMQPFEEGRNVRWTLSSSSRAKIDENGVLTALKTGTVTVTATAQDGSGKKASVKVEIIRAVQSIEITGSTELAGGKSGDLNAKVLPSNATNKTLVWESSDPELLRVNKYGDITAAKVDTVQQVTVYAKAKDGSGVVGSAVVTITPAAQKVVLQADGQETAEVVLDIGTSPVLQLSSRVEPADALQRVKWTTSSSSTAKVDENGVLTALKTGTVTVTATAQDGTGKKASLKVKIIRAVQSIAVSGDTELIGGESGKLRASVLPANATNDDVTWESSDPSALSVNRYGSIEAKRVDTVRQVTVYAKAKDGSGVVGSVVVTVTPRASKVVVTRDGTAVTKVGIDLDGSRMLQLGAHIEPAEALQNVKWTSSSSKRAVVDQNGMVHALSTGTVTLTAASTDGSGVRAQITVNVGYMVKHIDIVGPMQVTGGSSITLSTRVQPSNATQKGVVWSSSDESIASVSSSGKVTAKKVSELKQVTITATAKDGGGAVAEYTVQVLPRAQSLTIVREDANMGRALLLDKNGGSAQLSAEIYPLTASRDVTWTSSHKSVATVTADGLVVGHATGTAIITARANDGSGVKATLRVGVADVSTRPYYLEVDRANQVVRVYERGEDNSYTKLIKRMICSTGVSGCEGLDNGLYMMSGSRMVWMDGVAIYATRIKDCYLFHSVTYTRRSMDALNKTAYAKLGSRASAGCIRLLSGDAKWIYDNVPSHCFTYIMQGVRDVSEYGAVTKPPLKSGKWDPTNPHPDNPDFDPTYTSDVDPES